MMRGGPTLMQVLAATLWLCVGGLVPAQAQSSLPHGLVDRSFYDGRIQALHQVLRFCIVTNSPLRDLDRAIADAIGSTLLIRVETFDLDLSIVQNSSERERVLFINLTDNCELMMGANLAWRPLPDWLTISRPYYNAPYVLAVREGTYDSLGEIPVRSAVGSSLLSVVDQQFSTYLESLQPERRWYRLPYDDIPTMLADIRAGTIEGGLLPAPFAGSSTSSALDGLDLVSIAPLKDDPMQLGALLLVRHAFLRTAVDQAIDALQQDGTIDRIIAEHGLPPQSEF